MLLAQTSSLQLYSLFIDDLTTIIPPSALQSSDTIIHLTIEQTIRLTQRGCSVLFLTKGIGKEFNDTREGYSLQLKLRRSRRA
jgi:hypothetical protein